MTARRAAELIRAAHGYIDCTMGVFILSSSKAPLALCDRCRAEHRTAEAMEACACLTCHGFYSATLSKERAEQMIRQHPGGLLAVRTGWPSRMVVLDVDGPPREGLVTMRRLVADGQLPRTRVQRSGGGGYHFAYSHPGGRIRGGANKADPGIDIKADGGYIVVAPSVHPRTRQPYRWLTPFTDPLTPLPQVWADRLREVPRPLPAPGSWRAPVSRAGSYGAAALRAEPRQVAETTSCRNDQLNRSAFALGQLAAAGMLTPEEITAALMDAASACGLVADDGQASCQRTIASGLRAGMAQPRPGAVA